mgnify:CR=1 FL=1
MTLNSEDVPACVGNATSKLIAALPVQLLPALCTTTGGVALQAGLHSTPTTIFKRGVGFDPAKLVASVSGRVGLW